MPLTKALHKVEGNHAFSGYEKYAVSSPTVTLPSRVFVAVISKEGSSRQIKLAKDDESLLIVARKTTV